MRLALLLVAFTVFALLGVGTASARVIGEECGCGAEGCKDLIHEPLCVEPSLPRQDPGNLALNGGYCLGQCLKAAGGNKP